MYFGNICKLFILLLLLVSVSVCSISDGETVRVDPNSQGEPIELLIKFQADGIAAGVDPTTGAINYDLTAAGYVPSITANALISKTIGVESIVQIENTTISFEPFDFAAPPPIVNFTCDQCVLNFNNGSVFQSNPDVPLTGRSMFSFGPVAFDPSNPTLLTIRMMGCAGLQETTGTGTYAGMVGSICFNGVFNFDVSDPPASLATITGSSNCTITLHTPAPAGA